MIIINDEGHDYLESRRGQKPPCSVDSFLDLFSVRSLNTATLTSTYSWMERARLVFTFIYVSTNFIVYLDNRAKLYGKQLTTND